jgi:hypothetical protein
MVQADNLDVGGESWSEELTNALVNAADLGTLWDQYGIVEDVMVSKLLDLVHVRLMITLPVCSAPFMSLGHTSPHLAPPLHRILAL